MKTCSPFIVLCMIIQDTEAWSKTAFALELNIFVLFAPSTIYPLQTVITVDLH